MGPTLTTNKSYYIAHKKCVTCWPLKEASCLIGKDRRGALLFLYLQTFLSRPPQGNGTLNSREVNDEELSFSGLLAAAARMEEVKNLISNPEHLAVMTILFQIISADF